MSTSPSTFADDLSLSKDQNLTRGDPVTRFRIWSEHLSLEALNTPETLRLLLYGQLHPLVDVSPETDIDKLADLFRRYTQHGLDPGIWPLLDDKEGYWPSEYNADRYFSHALSIISGLKAHNVLPSWVAVDLEPPICQIDALRQCFCSPQAVMKIVRQNMDAARFFKPRANTRTDSQRFAFRASRRSP